MLNTKPPTPDEEKGNDMEELKRCPFCGSGAVIKYCMSEGWVACKSCGVRTDMYSNYDMPVEAWNRRV